MVNSFRERVDNAAKALPPQARKRQNSAVDEAALQKALSEAMSPDESRPGPRSAIVFTTTIRCIRGSSSPSSQRS
jgi:hypothetical protein